MPYVKGIFEKLVKPPRESIIIPSRPGVFEIDFW